MRYVVPAPTTRSLLSERTVTSNSSSQRQLYLWLQVRPCGRKEFQFGFFFFPLLGSVTCLLKRSARRSSCGGKCSRASRTVSPNGAPSATSATTDATASATARGAPRRASATAAGERGHGEHQSRARSTPSGSRRSARRHQQQQQQHHDRRRGAPTAEPGRGATSSVRQRRHRAPGSGRRTARAACQQPRPARRSGVQRGASRPRRSPRSSMNSAVTSARHAVALKTTT